MRSRRRIWLLVLLVAGAALVAARPVRSGLKRGVRAVLARIRLTERRRLQPEDASFSHLAVSQVGYGPGMEKRFTAPVAFRSFEVRDPDGRVAFRGGGPVRQLSTDLLGERREVWVGDFSALATPGRYRLVIDDGREKIGRAHV